MKCKHTYRHDNNFLKCCAKKKKKKPHRLLKKTCKREKLYFAWTWKSSLRYDLKDEKK